MRGSQLAVAAPAHKAPTLLLLRCRAVTLATVFPRLLAPLRASGEGLAAILMQLFFASVGASGSIAVVMKTAPALFLWSAIGVSSEGTTLTLSSTCSAVWRADCACLAPLDAQHTWCWCWLASGCWVSHGRRAAWHPMPTLEVRWWDGGAFLAPVCAAGCLHRHHNPCSPLQAPPQPQAWPLPRAGAAAWCRRCS